MWECVWMRVLAVWQLHCQCMCVTVKAGIADDWWAFIIKYCVKRKCHEAPRGGGTKPRCAQAKWRKMPKQLTVICHKRTRMLNGATLKNVTLLVCLRMSAHVCVCVCGEYNSSKSTRNHSLLYPFHFRPKHTFKFKLVFNLFERFLEQLELADAACILFSLNKSVSENTKQTG